MPSVVLVTPWFSDNALRFIEAVANQPGLQFGLVSQEPQEHLPPALRSRITAHWRVDDALSADQLTQAVAGLRQRLGAVDRLLGAMEQIQVQLAEVREQLGIDGMRVETALNFRDKARMKELFRSAGVPCARAARVRSADEAWLFANDIGYPLVLKPIAGAGSQTTYQIDSPEAMQNALGQVAPAPEREAILEEFIVGEEQSLETISIAGQPIWHSLTHYLPTPLDAMRHPWIQWCVLLPREVDDARYDAIRQVGRRALDVLGMQTGLTHLEWFRRRDGSVAVSEVAARPPGAQIMTLISRANDIDAVAAWVHLMIYGEFQPPTRRYAAGAAFLRGQGQGRVRAIHGLEQADRELGWLVCDVRLPQIGQPASVSYEGEGFIIFRHPETEVVEQALRRVVELVRVELGP